MGFIRVRAVNGPLHEFDVSEEAVKADPDIYEVLDKKPVAVSRPAKYVLPKADAKGGKKE